MWKDMAILLPHIEDSRLTHYISPKDDYIIFSDSTHYADKVKEWGLSSSKEVKQEFWYKEKTHQRLVTIKGYQTFGQTGEFDTLIIEFKDGNLSCIHPAYLKEMQSGSFGKEVRTNEVSLSTNETTETDTVTVSDLKNDASDMSSPDNKTKTNKSQKEKTAKLVLPEDKVHFSATVKQFALSWNHFNEENDEVVVLENVQIEGEIATEVGLAWCAHSKTLKKLELSPGETLEFDGKIVKKSLPKGKQVEDESLRLDVSVPYKINNPSKLIKK